MLRAEAAALEADRNSEAEAAQRWQHEHQLGQDIRDEFGAQQEQVLQQKQPRQQKQQEKQEQLHEDLDLHQKRVQQIQQDHQSEQEKLHEKQNIQDIHVQVHDQKQQLQREQLNKHQDLHQKQDDVVIVGQTQPFRKDTDGAELVQDDSDDEEDDKRNVDDDDEDDNEHEEDGDEDEDEDTEAEGTYMRPGATLASATGVSKTTHFVKGKQAKQHAQWHPQVHQNQQVQQYQDSDAGNRHARARSTLQSQKQVNFMMNKKKHSTSPASGSASMVISHTSSLLQPDSSHDDLTALARTSTQQSATQTRDVGQSKWKGRVQWPPPPISTTVQRTRSLSRKTSPPPQRSVSSDTYPSLESPSKPHDSPFDPKDKTLALFKKGFRRTKTASSWVPKSLAPSCYGCKTKFWWLAPNWTKHHCRIDGNVYCSACTQHRISLEPGEEPVRVCNSCYYKKLKETGIERQEMPKHVNTVLEESSTSWMLPGEELVGKFEHIWFENEPHGSVLLTTFQLILFDPSSSLRAVAHIPLMSIERIEILIYDACEAGVLNIHCKNFRFLRLVVFGMVSEQRFVKFHELEHALVRLAFPSGTSSKAETFSCVLDHTILKGIPSAPELNNFSGCCLDNHVNDLQELERLVKDVPGWRVSRANENFELCPSYPRFLAVPAKVSDTELKLVADFRIRRRIPILSWIDPVMKVAVCRSSQPKSGPWYRRSIADEKLIREVALASKSGLVIIDARPPANASANRIKSGGGFEDVINYNSHTGQAPVSIEFMNLENTNVVRASMNKLKQIVGTRLKRERKFVLGANGKYVMSDADTHPGALSLDDEDGIEFEISWLTKLAETRWIHLLAYIIKATCRVIQIIKEEKKCVLVHCSDGWDRTAQVVSLSILCMDSYYRTVKGFIALLEKEWFSVGHAIRTRSATGAPPGAKSSREVITHSSSHVAPVLVQFMDCVWQLTQQFPKSFEFNVKLLVTVLDRVYSAQFGNFLANSRKEVLDDNLLFTSHCAWSDIYQDPTPYMNSLYDVATSPATLHPSFSTKQLQLWRDYYLRFDESCRDEGLPAKTIPIAPSNRVGPCVQTKHATPDEPRPKPRHASVVELYVDSSMYNADTDSVGLRSDVEGEFPLEEESARSPLDPSSATKSLESLRSTSMSEGTSAHALHSPGHASTGPGESDERPATPPQRSLSNLG